MKERWALAVPTRANSEDAAPVATVCAFNWVAAAQLLPALSEEHKGCITSWRSQLSHVTGGND